MTDAGRVYKKLAFIEACLTDLRALPDLARIEDDLHIERFVEHTLQLAIQAALDVAAHVVADERLGEPRTNRELLDLLCRHGWADQADRQDLSNMAGFRNLLVHGYADVDPAAVRDVVENHLGVLDRFAAGIRSRLDASQPC